MYSQNSIDYMPWSVSKLDVAKSCALKFKLKYIDKQPEPEVSDSRGRIGKGAHKALELVLRGQDLTRAMTKAVIDEKLTTKESDDLILYKPNITNFLDKLATYKKVHNVEKQLVEYKFGLTSDFAPTGFFAKNVFFRGVIDLALVLPKGVVVILDHKSGAPAPMTKYATQLNSYSVAGPTLVSGVTGVQTAVHFLQDKTILWEGFVSSDEIENTCKAKLVEAINDSTRNITKDDPKATSGPWCTFCGYKAGCPAWQ